MKPAPRHVLAASIAAVFAALGCTSSGSGGTGGSSAYCSALQGYASKCNITDPCTTASLQNCAAASAVLSSAYLSTITSCVSEATCVDGGGATATACFTSGVASLMPTAAQQKLAADYCAACAASQFQTTTQCQANFYKAADGGIAGVGSFFLEYSDTIVTAIDTQCTPALADAGLLGCGFTLIECAEAQITKTYTPPVACTTVSIGDASL
jgi:hypothetical protein